MRNFIFIGLLALLFSGCSENIAKVYLPDYIMNQPYDESQYDKNKSYINKAGEIDLGKIKMDDYKDINKRNEFIAKAISLSDRKCAIHKAAILGNSHVWNIGAGSTAMLFSGAAAVVNHAQTAAELAAAATGMSGIHSLVNEEIYANKLGTSILRAIDVARAKRKAPLELGMRDSSYSLPIALIDLQAYHESCSLMIGLVELTKALDNRQLSRDELERDIKTLKKEIDEINSSKSIDPSKKEIIKNRYVETLQEKTLQLMGTPSE
jgi:hypothetical protein